MDAEAMIERAQAAMAKLLLSATSVDRDVRYEADDAVKELIRFIEGPAWLRRPDYRGKGVVETMADDVELTEARLSSIRTWFAGLPHDIESAPEVLADIEALAARTPSPVSVEEVARAIYEVMDIQDGLDPQAAERYANAAIAALSARP